MEEASNFESKTGGKPLQLLLEITSKMCIIQKAKYKFETLTKALERFMNIKLEDNKSILDYAKKFKQVKDIAQKTLENNLLNKFVKGGNS